MTRWSSVPEALAAAGDPRSPQTATRLLELLVSDAPDEEPSTEEAVGIAAAVAAVDRRWLVTLGEDPAHPLGVIEAATAACRAWRMLTGASLLPLRYAAVELCGPLGTPDEAVPALRSARLDTFGAPDVHATLATARLHDDDTGAVRTATAASGPLAQDPLLLSGVLLAHLAQGQRVEAEDALMRLTLSEVPGVVAARVRADVSSYLALSGQWERGLALLRHATAPEPTAATPWSVLQQAVGTGQLLAEAVRQGDSARALGADILLEAAGQRLKVSSWDTLSHAHEDVTAFARALAASFDMRNGSTGVGTRVGRRLSAAAGSLGPRAYGTVTGTVADRRVLANHARLLARTREVLVTASGYGVDSVREQAMTTAEEVSQSLALVIDESQLETIVELRLAFARLLVLLGASERACRECEDTTELCLSQGWTDLALASTVIGARAAENSGATARSEHGWERAAELVGAWNVSRTRERLTVLADALGNAATTARTMTLIAEHLTRRLTDAPAEDASDAAHEALSRARAQLARTPEPDADLVARLEAVAASLAGPEAGSEQL
ncbi:hypothetical protein [Actinomyces respiraculi]|uniref:hypothetical protein n=1 Tax=Actinomyces respiraculi TaxID=2744574 RepID=UPI001423C182|nr:hypothetical protein [Actinomyces respiraculi]